VIHSKSSQSSLPPVCIIPFYYWPHHNNKALHAGFDTDNVLHLKQSFKQQM